MVVQTIFVIIVIILIFIIVIIITIAIIIAAGSSRNLKMSFRFDAISFMDTGKCVASVRYSVALHGSKRRILKTYMLRACDEATIQ